MIYFIFHKIDHSYLCYEHGSGNAINETIQIIASCLNLKPNAINLLLDCSVSPKKQRDIIDITLKRIKYKIPIAYLTNRSWFCNTEFYVDRRVFIPRSPIGELIANNFYPLINKMPSSILDMCTGSGCIAISCALIFPMVKIDAVDISINALNVAKINSKLHSTHKRVKFIHSNLFEKLHLKRYDIIISNPPYVSFKNMISLPKEYTYEPYIALNSGNDGLNIVKNILLKADDYLEKDGILICEVGYNKQKLIKQYPKIQFIWLEFNNGGDGVFILNKNQLSKIKKYFFK